MRKFKKLSAFLKAHLKAQILNSVNINLIS